jgi:hypothetical protein
MESTGRLLIAFPTGHNELRAVFSEPIASEAAERADSYSTELGLKILAAYVNPDDRRRVTLRTEPMDGEAMKVDVLRAKGVRTANGASLIVTESPRFIQGIASIPGTQKPAAEEFPFSSRFTGTVATASCQKDGGVDSNILIDTLGYSFLHRETGGPFNSIKVVVGIGKKHVPGIEEAVERLSPHGLSPHVLWSGGEIRNVDGETQLVDTGFMEGSIMEATPKRFPPPYSIKTSEIAQKEAGTLRAKSFQGVIVRFENVTIDSISPPDERKLRKFVFHDESGVKVPGILLHTVTTKLAPGQRFQAVRGIVHRPRSGEYEVLVEMDKHLNSRSRQNFRVNLEGLELSPVDIERISRAVQKAVLTELAGMDLAPRFRVNLVESGDDGTTQGMQIVAEQGESSK